MVGALFKFINLPQKPKSALDHKGNVEYLIKWSMKGNLKIFYYNFNQQFQMYQKQDFVNAFFNDPAVYSSLETFRNGKWSPLGEPPQRIECDLVPATVTSLTFFDRILKDECKIVVGTDEIRNNFEEVVEGFYVSDELRYMLLDRNHPNYNLFSESERKEFIFRIFLHLCMGGQYCQYDTRLKPYLDVTKSIYKDIISVERAEGEELRIRSAVLKVVAYGANDVAVCPTSPQHLQNFVYLIIDPFKRQVQVLVHHYEGEFNA